MELTGNITAENILGVWLKAKVECPKDKTVIETGTWSNHGHVFIHATCPKCNLTALMHVREIERAPEQHPITEKEEE